MYSNNLRILWDGLFKYGGYNRPPGWPRCHFFPYRSNRVLYRSNRVLIEVVLQISLLSARTLVYCILFYMLFYLGPLMVIIYVYKDRIQETLPKNNTAMTIYICVSIMNYISAKTWKFLESRAMSLTAAMAAAADIKLKKTTLSQCHVFCKGLSLLFIAL